VTSSSPSYRHRQQLKPSLRTEQNSSSKLIKSQEKTLNRSVDNFLNKDISNPIMNQTDEKYVEQRSNVYNNMNGKILNYKNSLLLNKPTISLSKHNSFTSLGAGTQGSSDDFRRINPHCSKSKENLSIKTKGNLLFFSLILYLRSPNNIALHVYF
jgi:hypothetical protein